MDKISAATIWDFEEIFLNGGTCASRGRVDLDHGSGLYGDVIPGRGFFRLDSAAHRL